MQQLCISASYRFDKALVWSDSYTTESKYSRITVDENRFHKSILEAIAIVDPHIKFNKTQRPRPVYRDWSDGTAYQCGWLYRCSTDFDGKIYYGDAWITIHGMLTSYPFPNSL